jgi:hypothetical protein
MPGAEERYKGAEAGRPMSNRYGQMIPSTAIASLDPGPLLHSNPLHIPR